jgi:hypothetical protein
MPRRWIRRDIPQMDTEQWRIDVSQRKIPASEDNQRGIDQNA